MAEKIHILGAGLSGMVAAINLARQGREVLVIEGGKGLGGMGGLHPSVHSTPVDPAWMSEQVGVDLRPAFHPLKNFLAGMGPRVYRLDPGPIHAVERGARKGSIDVLLYDQAREAGVQFEFGTYLKDLREIPKGSIIATGLQPEMYDYFDIPCEVTRGYASIGKSDREPWCGSIFSSYTDDYFYTNCANSLSYSLLFGRSKVPVGALEECRKDVKKKFEMDIDKWEFFTGRVPTGSARNPRLFHDGYILAGTLSGAMDPGALFGIHGAILSGKVAAEAVEDSDRAMREFKRLTRYYRIGYYMRAIFSRLPRGEFDMFEFNMKHPVLSFPMMALASLSIPGYRQSMWSREIMKNAERIQ